MAEPFKNWIHPAAIATMGRSLRDVRPGFDADAWQADACRGLEDLSLKERVVQGADTLRAHLAPEWDEALAHLVEALPPPLSERESVVTYTPWWIFCTVVERHGHVAPVRSVEALREMTRRWSAEFAVRPYLRDQPRATLDQLATWLDDEDVHVRRWISEGTRPRLPWGERLRAFAADPTWTTPLLDALVGDPQEYVRRSVANHLGDIAKDHPEVAVSLARRWREAHNTAEVEWVVRHGLRHLLKQGHAPALALLGHEPVRVRATELRVTPHVAVGEVVEVDVTLACDGPPSPALRVDLVLGFRRKDGSVGRKVFRWTDAVPDADGVWRGAKRVSMRPVSTRRYYAGAQRVGVQVNGALVGETWFELT